MDNFQKRFAEVVWQREPELLGDDLTSFRGLLADYIPHPAYRRAILIAIECKVADSIRTAKPETFPVLRSQFLRRLSTQGLRLEDAEWTVDTLALTLGAEFDPEACFQMGRRLAPDRLLAQLETTELDDANLIRAACCFRRSASTGHAEACLWLGEMHRLGKGLQCDPHEGSRWVRRGAESGSAGAQYALGRAYRLGIGIEESIIKAIEWLNKAAEQGVAGAQWELGQIYSWPIYERQNIPLALTWLQKAAVQGHWRAAEELGELHQRQGNNPDAILWFTKAASSGDSHTSLSRLGDLLASPPVANFPEAFRWYSEGAKRGDGVCISRLAGMYEEGKGVIRDTNKALELWQSLTVDVSHMGEIAAFNVLRMEAETGDPTAQVNLGITFENGEHPLGRRFESGRDANIPDFEQAARWYRIAAEAGDAAGQYNLGDMYEHGKGVKADKEEAMKWYCAAATQGHLASQKQLGDIFFEGEAVSKDYEESLKWFLLAAKQGDAYAQYSAGWLYEHDDSLEGYDEFESEAGEWDWLEGERGAVLYWKAALQGHAEAAYRLAKLIEELGFNTAELYIEDQIRWHEMAACEGHIKSAFEAACLLEAGRYEGEELDEKQVADNGRAFKWFLMAAEAGHERSQLSLSHMYKDGRGVSKNPKEALRWALRAAEQGASDAQLIVSEMYSGGHGVKENRKEAAEWCLKAAKSGDSLAMDHLGKLYRLSSKEESFKWFYAAAEKGLSSAQSEVGWAYEFGSGVTRDYTLAFEWYKKAADRDNMEAQARLGFLYESGLGVPIDLSEARRYYDLAARQGYIVGATPLADEILAEHLVKKEQSS